MKRRRVDRFDRLFPVALIVAIVIVVLIEVV